MNYPEESVHWLSHIKKCHVTLSHVSPCIGCHSSLLPAIRFKSSIMFNGVNLQRQNVFVLVFVIYIAIEIIVIMSSIIEMLKTLYRTALSLFVRMWCNFIKLSMYTHLFFLFVFFIEECNIRKNSTHVYITYGAQSSTCFTDMTLSQYSNN